VQNLDVLQAGRVVVDSVRKTISPVKLFSKRPGYLGSTVDGVPDKNDFSPGA